MGEDDIPKLAVAALCVIFVPIIIVIHRFLRHNPVKSISNSCYAHTELKPQRLFQRILADNSYYPFTHLKSEIFTNSALVDTSKGRVLANVHPFEADILCLIDSPNVPFVTRDDASRKDMLDAYVWVDTQSGLEELVVELGREKVFAVDTEQHSLRSFLGFTALMQISTRYNDFLVDVIAVHDVMDVMRPIFADRSICKVFHGADNDIIWLQRDFHIYVVNIFDTAKACDLLSKPQKSLAYLLEVYCGVVTNKLLQRADWRHRPLSVDMEVYARTDAHYLLHIASCLFDELKQKSNEGSASCDKKFDSVFEASQRSNMICLQLYMKEVEAFPGESAASSILHRMANGAFGVSSKYFEMKFQDAVKCLCSWRDLMARIHDESSRYVLSDQAIIDLAGKFQPGEKEIRETIKQADRIDDDVEDPLLSSPSPVVCSHMEDLILILEQHTYDLQAFFLSLLQKHVGPGGGCPLSTYNFSILSCFNSNPRQTIIPTATGSRGHKLHNRKVSRQLFVKKFSCKAPVYHNCRIYANDGRLLCYCDRKKIEWYLSRDLARVVEDDPPTIVLLFEPKGRREDGDDNRFYVQTRRNICVGCGEGGHYLRYRVIPSCYRINFPEHLKSHRSHDIVLLCVDCHEVAHVAAERYKREIAVEFGVPLFVRNVVEDSSDTCYIRSGDSPLCDVSISPIQLRSAAMALLRHGQSMPLARHEELTQIMRRYYGRSEIGRGDLEKAVLTGMSPHERRRLGKRKNKLNHGAELDELFDYSKCGVDKMGIALQPCSKSVLGHGPHGKQVVDHILKEMGEDSIALFCQRWRRVFVDALHPRFLPSGWDIIHSGRREFGDYSVYNPSNKILIPN